MGHAERDNIMESRTGSASSRPGSSPRGRDQTPSPFCPRSSSKLTQSIVRDHMMSHYKRLYSAKAAIDTSRPKSMIHSVKYNDQIRQERLRKGGRPQSAHSLSQRNSRASCSSAQSRLSAHYDDSPYLSRSSMFSSPKLNTSFNTEDIVYPSKVRPHNQHHYIRPASEMKYRSPEATLNRRQSACSLVAPGDQSSDKAFQDPFQKTYSGDLLKKHSQHFTQDKPFTPKTLKSDKSSYLSKYRYYRAPLWKTNENATTSRLLRQETYHGSTKTKENIQELYSSDQGFNTEREWSEDGFSAARLSAASRANKSRDDSFTSSRVSPEREKSPSMKNITSEEEELMYLEFISGVTEDILNRAHISDRVLDRVMERHIDMNRHYLDEGKMRHLLELLRKEFEEPTSTSHTGTEPEKEEIGLFDALLPRVESEREEAKTEDDLFLYESLRKKYNLPELSDSLLMSPPLCSSEKSASPPETNGIDGESDNFNESINTSWLSEQVPDNAALTEEDFHQNQTDKTAFNEEISNDSQECNSESSDKAYPEDMAEGKHSGQSEELDDLGRSLSESLHVSSSIQHNNLETTEQHVNTAASVSDDEF
ncbi:spermatogenesis-associated protein 7 homolog [Xyrichtys novacula]|uniref:Spermatogenesis-associated protein 7 homolog n=1 Tax=Xyrichtys novacula TaxID=13765 RepID=A0AAV1GH48_XYRNO|nr:spermatogenesis-associated protein 7 homolog [Xyrichtys novacula]